MSIGLCYVSCGKLVLLVELGIWLVPILVLYKLWRLLRLSV